MLREFQDEITRLRAELAASRGGSDGTVGNSGATGGGEGKHSGGGEGKVVEKVVEKVVIKEVGISEEKIRELEDKTAKEKEELIKKVSKS